MDKSYQSSGGSATSTTTGSTSSSNVNSVNIRDHYLKNLNKFSHKISKPSTATNAPPIIKKPSFDQAQNLTQALPPPQLQQPQPSQPQPQNPDQSNLQAQQHQPPVYNINKNDFRDVVQKLTGSPAHERFSRPPPINQPKPQSSRLQRIRPPPLAHVSNRPPPMINCAVPNMNPPGCSQPNLPITGPIGNSFIQRPPAAAPLSPLPPLPSVHAAAESPVSAYLRHFQSSMSTTVDSNAKQFSGFSPLAPLISPRWNNLTALPPPPPQQQQPPQPQQAQPHQQQQSPQVSSAGTIQSQLPSSPPPFGCMNSPRSSYGLLSPSLLFSPNSGQLGFPLSPTVPLPSPKWRGL